MLHCVWTTCTLQSLNWRKEVLSLPLLHIGSIRICKLCSSMCFVIGTANHAFRSTITVVERKIVIKYDLWAYEKAQWCIPTAKIILQIKGNFKQPCSELCTVMFTKNALLKEFHLSKKIIMNIIKFSHHQPTCCRKVSALYFHDNLFGSVLVILIPCNRYPEVIECIPPQKY